MSEQLDDAPDDASDDAIDDIGDAQPGGVMLFLAALVVGIVVVVALLYGFLWWAFDAGN